MSRLERRLQILLDQERFLRLENEASRTGRSIAAVVREAIDYRFSSEQAARAAAGHRLLAGSASVRAAERDWAETKRAIEEEAETVVR